MGTPIPLTACFLFEGLTEAEQQHVTARLDAPITYRKGAVVYSPREFRHAVGVVLSGSVTVRSHRMMANRLVAGDCFGVAALFGSEADGYVTDITADSETAIVFIPQEQMAAFLAAIPRLAENYIRFLSDRIRFLNRKLSALTDGDAVTRVYRYLLAHCDEHGAVHVAVSMTELADTLNMGRSSLYRALDTLLQERMLQKEGNTYRVTDKKGRSL